MYGQVQLGSVILSVRGEPSRQFLNIARLPTLMESYSPRPNTYNISLGSSLIHSWQLFLAKQITCLGHRGVNGDRVNTSLAIIPLKGKLQDTE